MFLGQKKVEERTFNSALFPAGTFSSKCGIKEGTTAWLHKQRCGCVRKSLLEYFTKKVGKSFTVKLRN